MFYLRMFCERGKETDWVFCWVRGVDLRSWFSPRGLWFCGFEFPSDAKESNAHIYLSACLDLGQEGKGD